MHTYHHTKLQAEAQEIRLLVLQPGSFEEDINFCIEHKSLTPLPNDPARSRRLTVEELQKTLPANWIVKECLNRKYLFGCESPPHTSWTHPVPGFDRELYEPSASQQDQFEPNYEALSYTWGSVDRPIAARVLSRQHSAEAFESLLIGQNLACALRHLRFTDQPRTLWVDAICINQDDQDERNAQVKHMGSIFARAARVVVWLGPEGKDSKDALPVLQYLSEQVEPTVDNFRAPSPNATEPEWHDRGYLLPYDEETWSALIAFFKRDWFRRVWVVQEVRLANLSAVVQCGRASLPWQSVRKAMVILGDKSYLPHDLFPIMVQTGLVSRIGRTRDEIDVLLANGRGLQCSDPRDRVYAMLGLTSAGFADRIPPQYGLPVSEVYKQAFLAHSDLTQRLELFRCCRLVELPSDFPSWVPNWERNDPYSSRTSERSTSRISAAHMRYLRPRTLEVIGKFCGKVSSVGPPARGSDEDILEIIRTWMPQNSQRQYRESNETLLDAFLYVLYLGNIQERIPNSGHRSIDNTREHFWAMIDSPPAVSDRRKEAGIDLRSMRGKAFFDTNEGHIGLAVSEVEAGASSFLGSAHCCSPYGTDDHIWIVLGCSFPVVLRKLQTGDFRVVGPCHYVHGLMEGEGLLGHIAQPWKPQYHNVDGMNTLHFFNSDTKVVSPDDPRAGPLPDEWEPAPRRPTADDPREFAHFKNKATGEIINSDPRLLPGALRSRGVALETIRLV